MARKSRKSNIDGIKIVNMLVVGDKIYNMDELPPEEKKKYAIILSDRFMAAAGYRRVEKK